MKLPRLCPLSMHGDCWWRRGALVLGYALCEGRDKWFKGSSIMLLREDVRLVVELSEGDVVGPGLSQRLG